MRFMIDDATKMDPRSLLTTAKMSAITDIVSPRTEYLAATGDDTLLVYEDVVLAVGDAVFKTDRLTLDTSNLDAGTSFQMGSDYYVYICDNGGDNEIFRLSLNSTFPNGFNADNSRKIGGFHFGQCRRHNEKMQPINAAGVERGAGWQSNIFQGIVPRSVWTLSHRPKCSPEGMVYLGSGTWIDIYLSSANGAGGVKSAYNELPTTGTEGHNWYAQNEMLGAAGKRMPSYAEFCRYALGAPAGADNNNTNAWAMTTNTARQRTGYVAPAVSSVGCRDTTGNVWEWMDEFITRYDSGTGAASIQSSFTYRDVLGGADQGQAYMNAGYQLIALRSGGSWNPGVIAGPRAVSCAIYPWNVYTNIGVRGACDSL